MKKILVIDGHPSDQGFCSGLAEAYVKEAQNSGHEVQRVNIRDLKFNPNLEHGYQKIQELEPDLVKSQEMVKWCEHLVLIYPMWWGSVPAILKGYFDRSWLPGFAFKYHKDDPWWDKLLSGRSARMIVTSDAPYFFNFLVYWNAPYRVVGKTILKFCGFSPVKLTAIGGVKNMNKTKRQKTIDQVGTLGAKGL